MSGLFLLPARIELAPKMQWFLASLMRDNANSRATYTWTCVIHAPSFGIARKVAQRFRRFDKDKAARLCGVVPVPSETCELGSLMALRQQAMRADFNPSAALLVPTRGGGGTFLRVPFGVYWSSVVLTQEGPKGPPVSVREALQRPDFAPWHWPQRPQLRTLI